MEYAKYIWVTEDSLSMIYESIAVGSEVTCINLKKKTNKLRDITNNLFEKKKINFFQTKNRKLNLNLSNRVQQMNVQNYLQNFLKLNEQ